LNKAFQAGVLDSWHNCLLTYWRTTCLYPHSTIPSVTCLRLIDASFICRFTYLQFPLQSTFLQYIATRPHPENLEKHSKFSGRTSSGGVLLVLIRNIGHRRCRKFGLVPFWCAAYIPGERLNWF